MKHSVPASRRAAARAAFIRALAKQTDAVRGLRAWRLPPSALDSERERTLRETLTPGGAGSVCASWMSWDPDKQTDVIHTHRSSPLTPARDSERERKMRELATSGAANHVSTSWMSMSREGLFRWAGSDRVDAAGAWTRQWKLGDVSWLHKWAVFAILWWDICRCCTVRECPHGCGAASADDDMEALALVLTLETMLDLEAQDGNMMSVVAQLGDSHIYGGEFVPLGIQLVVAPLAGPNPLLETREEFLRRGQAAWDEAVAEVAEQGLSVIVPRKLGLHCEWLVRYHVHGETAAEILRDSEDARSRDASTVYKAVRSVAGLLDLPLRLSSTNT